MRILFVCEGFDRYSIRAQPWKHVFEIAHRMKTSGNEVSILTNKNSLFPEEEILAGMRVRRISKRRFLFNADELTEALNDNHDLINWNASGVLSALHFIRAKKVQPTLIWTLHSGLVEYLDFKNLKLADILSLGRFWNTILCSVRPSAFIRKAISLTNLKIITLSERLRKHLLGLGIEERRIRVIYSGVDTNRFFPKRQKEVEKNREELHLSPSDKIVLYYGPMNPFRGADELISAMPSVLSSCPDSRFIFLGRVTRRDISSSLLKKHLIRHKRAVLVEGVQSQEVIAQYLSIADVVVLPFRFWPYVECPLTVLETMAAGKPVITSRIGAIPEMVQDNKTGLLVTPRRETISSAILMILRNRNLAERLGQNARKYVEKFHSWDYITRKTRETFQQWLA